VEEIICALRRVKTNESTTILGDFNAHFGNDTGVWRGVIGRHGVADVNENGRLLLQLWCNNALCIKNIEHLLPAQSCAQVHLVQIFLGSMVTH